MSQPVSIRVAHGYERASEAIRRKGGLESLELSEGARAGIQRVFGEPLTAAQVVDRIIADVRERGDEAIRHYSREIDRVELDRIEVPKSEWRAAFDSIDPELQEAMTVAARQIRSFHEKQKRTSWIDFGPDGALGQIVRPLERIGVYAPGGSAVYPSSLLMTAVPGRVAGVEEIFVSSPPGPKGISPLILAAALVADVDRVFQIGGAQAIAALAYGTESIPRVDKLFGPGNIFVVLAKRQVFGQVAIDQLPGPTETVVVADASADPRFTAADMLAQAEHDAMASALLITTSERLATLVQSELAVQVTQLERESIARESLASNGLIAVVETVEEAIALANDYAPEHLCLLLREPWDAVPLVKHAGGIFVGESSPEALGDYVIGPSHVMPTGGTARFFSPIHVGDFTKVINLAGANDRTLNRLGPAAVALATAEGLGAHARAIELRLEATRPD
ncbi:MAG TPA: histidinol dehydrogenase [Thermomicrobiales bacterium]|nr:histidinol dehydrogenase [Thermomicrobiales bacterium]